MLRNRRVGCDEKYKVEPTEGGGEKEGRETKINGKTETKSKSASETEKEKG